MWELQKSTQTSFCVKHISRAPLQRLGSGLGDWETAVPFQAGARKVSLPHRVHTGYGGPHRLLFNGYLRTVTVTHLQLVPRSRMHGSIRPLPPMTIRRLQLLWNLIRHREDKGSTFLRNVCVNHYPHKTQLHYTLPIFQFIFNKLRYKTRRPKQKTLQHYGMSAGLLSLHNHSQRALVNTVLKVQTH
jgi:hypothetical protein